MDIVDGRFVSYVLVSTLLIMTPGPDMALVTRNALAGGRRAASFTAFGVGAGVLVWAAVSAVGVGALLERSIVAFTVLKLAGAVYLGYLGVRSLIAGSRASEQAVARPSRRKPTLLSARNAFGQGAVGNVLNPKAGVIFVSILPQFVRPGDAFIRLVVMLLMFEAVLLAWLHLYGYLVSRANQGRAGAAVRRALQRVTGVVLLGLGLRLAVERR